MVLTAREINFDDLSREGYKPEVHLNNIYELNWCLRENTWLLLYKHQLANEVEEKNLCSF